MMAHASLCVGNSAKTGASLGQLKLTIEKLEATMTLGLSQFLRFRKSSPHTNRLIPPLDIGGWGARDIADLNLPPREALRLAGREAAELRRALIGW